jgi:peptidyl-prolyl cis-trans isomerase D
MLELMRRQSYLIYLVFGGIIFIFAVNFGPGSSGCMRAAQTPWAARVNGRAVRQQEFAVGYGRQMDYMRRLAQQSGLEFDNAMAERFGIRAKVMEQLVERHLLAQEAEKRGISVSDADLLDYLREQYGVKDVTYDVYENWVNRTFETNVQKFEEDARGDVAAQRMARIVNDAIDIGEAELKEAFSREHDRARIEYVRFDVDPSAAKAPDEAAIAAVVRDELPALQSAYEADSFTYQTPLQVQARQIMRKLSAQATDAEVAQAQALLVDVAAQIGRGADFAALAKTHSEDTESRERGGDMGLVRRGQLVQALDDAVFKLQRQAITQTPVRSPEGLHLIQVTEIHPPQRQPFEQVQAQVAANVLRARGADAAAKQAARALHAAVGSSAAWEQATRPADAPTLEPGPLAQAEVTRRGKAVASRPERHSSSWILRSQVGMGRIGASKPMHDALFALPDGQPLAPDVYKVGEAYYVMRLKERETPDMAQFADARAELYEQALDTKRAHVLKEWLAYLRTQAKVEVNTALVHAPLVPEEEAGG